MDYYHFSSCRRYVKKGISPFVLKIPKVLRIHFCFYIVTIINTTSALDERSFDSYNQTTISGTTVLSAIRNFQNQPVAVLVRTKRSGDKVMNYDAYLGATSGATSPAWEHTKSDVSAPTGVTGMPSKLTTSQVLYAEQQNLDTTKSTKKSENHYINPNAKFKSVLVYDSNDEVVGIYIEQNGVTDPVLKDS